MGKKRVVEQTKEQVLEEKRKREALTEKGPELGSSKKVKTGKVYISSSFNNTKLTLTDPEGNVLYWSSAGKMGFKGTKKGTSFAASKAAQAVIKAIKDLGLKEIEVLVKGVGSGRNSALRTLGGAGVKIESISDVTPIPHNGCRPRKPRRV